MLFDDLRTHTLSNKQLSYSALLLSFDRIVTDRPQLWFSFQVQRQSNLAPFDRQLPWPQPIDPLHPSAYAPLSLSADHAVLFWVCTALKRTHTFLSSLVWPGFARTTLDIHHHLGFRSVIIIGPSWSTQPRQFVFCTLTIRTVLLSVFSPHARLTNSSFESFVCPVLHRSANPIIFIAGNMSQIKVLPSTEKLTESLLDALRTVLDSRPADQLLHVGLSGGSVIQLLLSLLPHLHGTSLPRFRFYFCDERLVPLDDIESTYGQYLKAIQQSGIALQVEQFIKVHEHLSAPDAADDYVRFVCLSTISSSSNQSIFICFSFFSGCSSLSKCAGFSERNSRIRCALLRNGTGWPHLLTVSRPSASQRTRTTSGCYRRQPKTAASTSDLHLSSAQQRSKCFLHCARQVEATGDQGKLSFRSSII